MLGEYAMDVELFCTASRTRDFSLRVQMAWKFRVAKLREFRWGEFQEMCGQFGLFSYVYAFGLEGLEDGNPPAFSIFASRGHTVCGAFLVASWWLSDALKWRATYFFLHWLQVSIYTTLLTRQFMFSGPQKVWPVTVHVIWFVVFTSWHHVQFGFGHLFRRSFRSFTIWIGFKRLARTSVSRRFRFLRYARIGVSGNIFLHSGDRCRTGQCLLMIFSKFGLSGLYVRTNGILCVPSAFVFVPWISSWWSWLRAFWYDSSMISSG